MTWNPLRARRDRALRRIAACFLALPDDHHYGFPLSRMAGVGTGSMYPTLARMETRGWLDSGWEEPLGDRRPRRYYTLTAEGRGELEAILRAGGRS